MEMTYISVSIKYDTHDHFELTSKPGRKSGKVRRYLAWPLFSLALAILMGKNGYDLAINGRKTENENH